MIPKIIYCTWKDDDLLPEQQACIETWRKHLPDYEIRRFTHADILHSPCTDATRKMDKWVGAAQYNVWRALYETGGLYLDLDVRVIKSFDRLLKDDAFIGIQSDGHVWAACGVLGFTRHHPFLREALDYMDEFDYDTPVEHFENQLGPRMWTNLLVKHGWARTDKTEVVDGVKVYDHTYFYPYSWKEEFTPGCVKKTTHAIHEWHSTWSQKCSVVIPCFNQGKYLDDAIESALAQTHRPLDIIVVNDGSTDDTSKVARKYKDRVTLIEQKNKGSAAARNTGVAAARGEYVVCLDADDKLHPDYLKRLVGIDDVASCHLIAFGSRLGAGWTPPRVHPTFADFRKANQVICGSLFRKEVWEAVGGFDEKMRDGYEDWDFWTRVAAKGFSFTVVPQVLFEYRTYPVVRDDVKGSFDWASKKDAEIKAYMDKKWVGVEVPSGPPLRYPITLGVECRLGDKTYPKGTKIDRETAVALKKAGQLKDPRIVG